MQNYIPNTGAHSSVETSQPWSQAVGNMHQRVSFLDVYDHSRLVPP